MQTLEIQAIMSLKYSNDLKHAVAEDALSRAHEAFEGLNLRRELDKLAPERRDELTRGISELEQRIGQLESDAPSLEDQAFDREMRSVFVDVGKIEDLAAGRDPSEPADYTTEVARAGTIKSLEDFEREVAMFWIPTKEDTARFIAIACSASEEQTRLGLKAPGEPVRIADIGGGNGFFANLLVELARENGIAVEITVVDPDPCTDAAREYYSDRPEIRFVRETAADFALKNAADSPELLAVLRERSELIEAGSTKLSYLSAIFGAINPDRPVETLVEPARLAEISRILRADFGMELQSGESMSEILDGFASIADPPIHQLGDRLEKLLPRPTFDLVLNSWMPPGVDFCRDVEAARGAALIYVKERGGATGLECPPRGTDMRCAGAEVSYMQRENYPQCAGWSGPSVMQVRMATMTRRMLPQGIDLPEGLDLDFFTPGEVRDEPLNRIKVYARSDFEGSIDEDYEARGIRLGEPYAWEAGLEAFLPAEEEQAPEL